MRRIVVFLGCLMIANQGVAQKRRHGAHEHGSASLDVAVDGKAINLRFESPAESIYGFEHEAKTPEQKKKQNDALKSLESNIANIVSLNPNLKCKTKSAATSIKEEEEHEDRGHGRDHDKVKEHAKKPAGKHHEEEEEHHSEVHLAATMECAKDVTGSKATVDFSKTFPQVKKLKIQVVTKGKPTGLTTTKFPVTIDL